jgi:dipeptidyl aminopeptidase/acylaminoacyl peptidase
MERFTKACRYFDLSDFYTIHEYMDGAISPNGKYVAFVSSCADSQNDEFVRAVYVLAISAEPETLWSSPQRGIHTLRFSPDSQYLAFFRAPSSDDAAGDELVIYSLATEQTKVLFEGDSNLSNLVWSPGSDALYFACETPPHSLAKNIQYVDTIPKRLPWWHKQMYIKKVSFIAMSTCDEVDIPLRREMLEIGHFCISRDGNELAFIEERCTNGTKITLYLHRIDLNRLQEAPEIILPNSSVTTPVFSPDGTYIAYIGGRVSGLQMQPVPLDSYSEITISQKGYGVNVYDTRVHLIDLPRLTIAQLATKAALCAGIPVGLSPLHQEIYWLDNLHISYIVTQGNQTALANQCIDSDDSLQVTPLGIGSSRGHSFTSDGTCFFFQSEKGQPFVPAILTGARSSLEFLPGIFNAIHTLDFVWHTPEIIDDIAACGAWMYLPPDTRDTSISPASIPLILSIYGGASPLCMAFDDAHQALVSRGYAVLVINPSGCGGFGPERADSHINDWGTSVVTEITDTLRIVLQRYPVLNPQAIGAYGGSYGGFLVLLLLAQTHMFKAACSIAGISNITSYWGGSRFGYQYGLAALSDSFPWSHQQLFVQQSPIFRANEITTPLLLLHGECDTIVPLSESEQIFVALKTLERDVHLVVFLDEDHGIRGCPSARFASRRYLLTWFDKVLRGLTDEWNELLNAGSA